MFVFIFLSLQFVGHLGVHIFEHLVKFVGSEVFCCRKLFVNLFFELLNQFLFVFDGKPLNFEFKWNDNMQENGNIMDFYVNGDTAPGGRFNFVYCE